MLLLNYPGNLRRPLLVAALFLLLTVAAQAQSTDVRFASPVRANEIDGTIPARDIGDARLTNHFYAFTGLPGDLLITVDCKNLNGDLDVFTAGELRPLLKISIYAETGSSIAKNIYLRKRESLILRIEARSPNDDSGTYRVRFSGSFEPTIGAPVAETDAQTTESETAGGRRASNVSSTGARIERPAPEVAVATPTPEPTPSATPESTTPIKPPPARTARGRRPVTRRPPPKPTVRTQPPATGSEAPTAADAEAEAAKKKKQNEAATAETPPAVAAPVPEENKPPVTTRRPPPRSSTVRRTPPPRTPPPPPAQPPPESGAKLVIEMNDGTRIEHFMNLVRRVTVENGVVVVVGKNGKVERVPMANVLHMSIGP